MVGKTASTGVEIVMTLLEGINHILEVDDVHAGLLTQCLHIIGKARLVNVHGLVGAPGGQHVNLETAFLDLLVINQVIYGIVGCADALNIEAGHQSACRKLREFEFLITFVIDLARSGWAEHLVYAKTRTKFKVSPVIQRIAVAVGNGVSPFLKLLPIRSITGNIFLINAIGTHSAPLVMVLSKPQFGNA